jgi:hypothetical protein
MCPEITSDHLSQPQLATRTGPNLRGASLFIGWADLEPKGEVRMLPEPLHLPPDSPDPPCGYPDPGVLNIRGLNDLGYREAIVAVEGQTVEIPPSLAGIKGDPQREELHQPSSDDEGLVAKSLRIHTG